jgi:hypothetical protein
MLESVLQALMKTVIRSAAPIVALVLLAAPLAAQTGSPPAVGSIRGTIVDSVRGGLLIGAAVDLLPSTRRVMTNDRGEFRFDSVAPGEGYQIKIFHPMLDTIGIAPTTPRFAVESGLIKVLTIAVPSPSQLVSMLCRPEQIARGPSALIGFVRDPDTGDPIDSASVSLVYVDEAFAVAKRPVTRVAALDAAGRYRICGLPMKMTGKVQLIRNATTSAEIPVETDTTSPLALRSLGMSLATLQVAGGKDSAGKSIRLLRGNARLVGRVVSKSGLPVAGARVQMDATASAAVTGPDGRFALDSVPTGTQTISVRKLGYSVTDKAVEVSSGDAVSVSVVMENYIPTLATVVSTAQRDKDMERIGFTRRKRQSMGTFRDGDEIPRGFSLLSETLATLPGIRVGHTSGPYGQRNVITGANGVGDCVTTFVDGVVWKDTDPNGNGIEDYIRPDELEAVELYSASTIPAEFMNAGQSRCKVLVLWTNHRVHRSTTKTSKPPS